LKKNRLAKILPGALSGCAVFFSGVNLRLSYIFSGYLSIQFSGWQQEQLNSFTGVKKLAVSLVYYPWKIVWPLS
jgi:hypothetical protein